MAGHFGAARSTKDALRYFAFGSNMGSEQMKERGVRFSKRLAAVLDGWRMEFSKQATRNPREGFANIVPDPANRVEGVLYEMAAEDLSKLDVYEGYPDHYTRREIVVSCGGRQETAVVYIAHPDRMKAGLQPSVEYLDRIQKGSDLLSEGYRDKLSNWEFID